MSVGGGHGDGCTTSPPQSPSPFHLLEVTVISAQNLHRRRFGRRVRAYAVARADHQAQRLRTDVDHTGGAAPTWNDRFLFRVDEAFLRSETSAVTVEVRGASGSLFGGDPVLGVTRIVVSTFLRPPPLARQMAALLLRRPRSLRPLGIINVAVSVLDDAHAARTVSLYNAPESPEAFAVKDLVMQRPASRSRVVAEDCHSNLDVDEDRKVDHSGRLDSRRAAVEQRKLVQTLEKWKADLSPGRKEDGRRGTWRALRTCFRGSGDCDR